MKAMVKCFYELNEKQVEEFMKECGYFNGYSQDDLIKELKKLDIKSLRIYAWHDSNENEIEIQGV